MKNISNTYLFHVGDLKLKNGKIWKNILCVEFNDTDKNAAPHGLKATRSNKTVPPYTAIFLNYSERLVIPFLDIKSFKYEEKPIRNFIMKNNT